MPPVPGAARAVLATALALVLCVQTGCSTAASRKKRAAKTHLSQTEERTVQLRHKLELLDKQTQNPQP